MRSILVHARTQICRILLFVCMCVCIGHVRSAHIPFFQAGMPLLDTEPSPPVERASSLGFRASSLLEEGRDDVVLLAAAQNRMHGCERVYANDEADRLRCSTKSEEAAVFGKGSRSPSLIDWLSSCTWMNLRGGADIDPADAHKHSSPINVAGQLQSFLESMTSHADRLLKLGDHKHRSISQDAAPHDLQNPLDCPLEDPPSYSQVTTKDAPKDTPKDAPEKPQTQARNFPPQAQGGEKRKEPQSTQDLGTPTADEAHTEVPQPPHSSGKDAAAPSQPQSPVKVPSPAAAAPAVSTASPAKQNTGNHKPSINRQISLGATPDSPLTAKKVSKLLRTTSDDILMLMSQFESRLHRLAQWKVVFKVRAKVKYGDALYITGDCDSLGRGNLDKAVRMSHAGDNEWSVLIEGVPEGTRYRYFIMRDTKDKSGGRSEDNIPHYTTSYPQELTAKMEDCNLSEGKLVQDDRKLEVRFKVHREADQVFVLGSLPCLGEWDMEKALKMERKGKCAWELTVPIAADDLSSFEYKFFATPGPVFETGNNRLSDAHLVEPQRDVRDGVLSSRRTINLECVWDGLLLRFIIFHPLQDKESVLACSGSHEHLGGWLGAPRSMGLGNERTLLTGVKGRCWEATFPATDADSINVQYRYCIINGTTKSAIFEREPNRVIEQIPGCLKAANIKEATLGIPEAVQKGEAGYRQREWQVYDGNFVPPDLSYDLVPPNLAIGPYPQTAKDVSLMREAGITGVLNVQTDGDHQRRLIDWKHMQGLYKEAGIDVIRVPIEDFHGGELSRLVKDGAKAVDDMVRKAKDKGKQPLVYIHCTAGMGRAPAVACVYMVWKEGYSLQDALTHVKKHRPVAAPNWHAMQEALAKGGF